ncbi:MAG: alpha/beta hydrolase [Oceanicaulis sp.]|nr:alpha/beta hydrolase [Oceanicaulis sp.]
MENALMAFVAETFESPTGASLRLHVQEAEGQPLGVIQIHHGLAEHSARYARFAAYLAGRGFHVAAHDHRGHGQTTAEDAPRGVFGAPKGWNKVVSDALAVEDHLKARFPGLPHIVFGHSMGGVVAMNHAMERKGEISGLAVWNSNLAIGGRAGLMRAVLNIESLFKKPQSASTWLEGLTFKAWGKQVKGHRTDFDWLSRIPKRSTPISMTRVRLAGLDLALARSDRRHGAGRKREPSARHAHRSRHPSGGGRRRPRDRQGTGGESARLTALQCPFSDVTMRRDPQARHETLNDIGYETAQSDFADWAERVARQQG